MIYDTVRELMSGLTSIATPVPQSGAEALHSKRWRAISRAAADCAERMECGRFIGALAALIGGTSSRESLKFHGSTPACPAAVGRESRPTKIDGVCPWPVGVSMADRRQETILRWVFDRARCYCARPNFLSSSRKLISTSVGRPCGQV